jgi:hypothetical protein
MVTKGSRRLNKGKGTRSTEARRQRAYHGGVREEVQEEIGSEEEDPYVPIFYEQIRVALQARNTTRFKAAQKKAKEEKKEKEKKEKEKPEKQPLRRSPRSTATTQPDTNTTTNANAPQTRAASCKLL